MGGMKDHFIQLGPSYMVMMKTIIVWNMWNIYPVKENTLLITFVLVVLIIQLPLKIFLALISLFLVAMLWILGC